MRKPEPNRQFNAVVVPIVAVLISFTLAGSLVHSMIFAVPAVVFMSALAYIVFRFRLQPLLLKSMALLLPFSVQIPVAEGSMVMFPTEFLAIIAAIVFFIEVAGYPVSKLRDSLHREFLWVLPLSAAYILTVPFSEIPLVSAKFSFINLLYILVFYLFMARQFMYDRTLFFHMVILYSLGMVSVMLWGIYRFYLWEWNPVVVRGIFQPFFNDHTIFGAAAALLAGLWLASVRNCMNNLTRLFWLIMGFFFIAAVVFSTSRAALISLAVFVVSMSLLYFKARLSHLFFITLSISVLVLIFHRPLTARLRQVTAVSSESQAGIASRTLSSVNITTDVSNIERLNRWISAWRMFREKPLTGFGPGTYQFLYIPYQEPSLMNPLTVRDPSNIPEGSGGTAHSEYLLLMSEMGILGIGGLLVFAGRLIFLAFSRIHRHNMRIILIAAMSALATYFFHAFFNNFLNSDKFAFLFWGTAAWFVSTYHFENDR